MAIVDQQQRLVDAGVVADRFQVTRQTVHDWRRAELIPYVRAKGTIRFDLEAVERALRRETTAAAERQERPA